MTKDKMIARSDSKIRLLNQAPFIRSNSPNTHATPALVSILIPAYNAEKWIGETIRSALAQTWPRTEIIVLDDGSKDGTLAVARQFESAQVKVISQMNQGAAAARNALSAASQGDYLQWLDADDLLSPDKITLQMKRQEREGNQKLLLSSEWGSFIHCTRRARFQPTPLWADLTPAEWLIRKLDSGAFMQTSTWLVSRQLSDAAGQWDGRMLQDDDGEYFCRVLMASDGVQFVPGAKVFYRKVGSNRLSYIGHSTRKLEAQFLSIKLHISYLMSLEDSERVRSACLNHLQQWLPHFYPELPDIVREMEQLAQSLGHSLEPARLSWKYAWIQQTFGWTAAKHAQYHYNRLKSALIRGWDRMLYSLEARDQHPIRVIKRLSLAPGSGCDRGNQGVAHPDAHRPLHPNPASKRDVLGEH